MKGVLEITGCLYAITKNANYPTASGAQIDLFGDTKEAKLMTIKGSVFADQVTFNGYVDIIHRAPTS